jgi:hypothetical protein
MRPKEKSSILWTVSGHGGQGPMAPTTPPPEPEEVVRARVALRLAEATFYAAREEFREVVARLDRKGQR